MDLRVGNARSGRLMRALLASVVPLAAVAVVCGAASAETPQTIAFTSTPPSAPVAGVGSYTVAAQSSSGGRL